MHPLIPRDLRSTLQDRLQRFPAVVLLGPRQVGKTTLARQVAREWQGLATYLDLERPADRRRFDAADAYLRSQAGNLLVLDEVQRLPGLFELLRGCIDERRNNGERSGMFLLLGSAGPDLLHQTSETLAGRVSFLQLDPLRIHETASIEVDLNRLWWRGGFPDSLLAPDDLGSHLWRQDFIRSYLERDVPMFAPRLPATTVGRLWTMLAHHQGGLLNQSQLAASLGISAPTVGRYIDLLVDLLLVRRLPPWSGNLGKRLTKRPKVYVRDSGLVHALLELSSPDALWGHPVVGASWEGMVIEQLLNNKGLERQACFFRTQAGAEIDLLLERGGQPETAIEVKRSQDPRLSRGFAMACDVLGVEERLVVYPGNATFPLRHGATAIPLETLCARLSDGVAT